MLIAIIAYMTLSFVAGLLIGAAIAYDKGYIVGKKWGLQLRAEQQESADIMARIRSLM